MFAPQRLQPSSGVFDGLGRHEASHYDHTAGTAAITRVYSRYPRSGASSVACVGRRVTIVCSSVFLAHEPLLEFADAHVAALEKRDAIFFRPPEDVVHRVVLSELAQPEVPNLERAVFLFLFLALKEFSFWFISPLIVGQS